MKNFFPLKFWDKSPACWQAGFTLVEVLIAIGIIVLIAAVAIPNLRNFREDALLSQAGAEVTAGLRKVQANAQSGVNCSTNNISSSWSIYFLPSQNKFELICNFEADDVETVVTEESSTLSNINMTAKCGEDNASNTKVTFNSISIGKTAVINPCEDGSDFIISLQSAKTDQIKNINIDQNGLVFEN